MKKILSSLFGRKKRQATKEAIESFKRLIAKRENDPFATESGTKVLRDRVAELEATL